MKRNIYLGGVVFSLLLAGPAVAQTVFTRPHDVLAQAIKQGHAEGQLIGQVADLFTKQFKSNGDLLVTASVLEPLERADCKRVRVVYTKKDVVGPKGVSDAVLDTRINYCLDGRAPPAARKP